MKVILNQNLELRKYIFLDSQYQKTIQHQWRQQNYWDLTCDCFNPCTSYTRPFYDYKPLPILTSSFFPPFKSTCIDPNLRGQIPNYLSDELSLTDFWSPKLNNSSKFICILYWSVAWGDYRGTDFIMAYFMTSIATVSSAVGFSRCCWYLVTSTLGW